MVAPVGRVLLLAGVAQLLAGCGFAPLYARGPSGGVGPVTRELSAVSVDIIGDRPGQLLRQALQDRLAGSGEGAAQRYELAVDYGISGEGIAIRQDSSVTRLRLVGSARWSLRAEDSARTLLAKAQARALDDVNIFNNQYFASDLDNEAAQRRLAITLADQIVSQLAAYFRRRSDKAVAAAH